VVGRLDRFRTWMAMVLLGSAVMGAVVAWRSSVAAAEASDLDQMQLSSSCNSDSLWPLRQA
jgi:hypothetical protein